MDFDNIERLNDVDLNNLYENMFENFDNNELIACYCFCRSISDGIAGTPGYVDCAYYSYCTYGCIAICNNRGFHVNSCACGPSGLHRWDVLCYTR